jgi:hypothetical protein
MANSLINFGIVKPELATSFATGFQQAQDRNRLLAQQERQNQLIDLQLRAAQRGEEEALATRQAYKSEDPVKSLYSAGLGTQAMALQKQQQEQRDAILNRVQQQHKAIKSIVNDIIALPTRENAQAKLAYAQSIGLDVSPYVAELNQTPDEKIKQWAFTHGVGADKALEQTIIQLPGGGTAVEPKYALGEAGPSAPMAVAPASAAMPSGIPGQTPMTRNALAQPPLPAPGMPVGSMATPTGGRYFPPAMTLAQQASEARAQQQLGMERERLELSKEESMRKRAEVPSETRKELTSIDQQRSVIDGALKAVKETPNAFSFARGAIAGALPYGESLAGRFETPEQTQARAYVFNNVSRVINERAGAAQSAQELQRLRSFLPADTDNAEQITNKLKGFQTYLKDLEKGTIKATSPATKEALEKTRGTQLSDIDKQALEWANSNPNDPRAVQIKQKLGVQ